MRLHKGIGADSWKLYHDNYFLTLANKNLFLWRHLEISLVLLFSKVSRSAQMMETFSDKHRLQRFEPCWYGETFLLISHDRLLSRPWPFKFHTVLITQYHSCIHGVWKILYGCHTVFWTPLQKFHSKQSCCWMFGFDLLLHLWLLSFVLFSTLQFALWLCFQYWYCSNNLTSKCLGWKSYGICCSWGKCFLTSLMNSFINICFHILAIWWVEPHNHPVSISSSVLSIAIIIRHILLYVHYPLVLIRR